MLDSSVVFGYLGVCWTQLYGVCKGGFWHVAEGTDGWVGRWARVACLLHLMRYLQQLQLLWLGFRGILWLDDVFYDDVAYIMVWVYGVWSAYGWGMVLGIGLSGEIEARIWYPRFVCMGSWRILDGWGRVWFGYDSCVEIYSRSICWLLSPVIDVKSWRIFKASSW